MDFCDTIIACQIKLQLDFQPLGGIVVVNTDVKVEDRRGGHHDWTSAMP